MPSNKVTVRVRLRVKPIPKIEPETFYSTHPTNPKLDGWPWDESLTNLKPLIKLYALFILAVIVISMFLYNLSSPSP